MSDPERERYAMKKESSGSISRGSYVLKISQNRIRNTILGAVKTLEDNKIILFIFMFQRKYLYIDDHKSL